VNVSVVQFVWFGALLKPTLIWNTELCQIETEVEPNKPENQHFGLNAPKPRPNY
jgi:hypothetical protein